MPLCHYVSPLHRPIELGEAGDSLHGLGALKRLRGKLGEEDSHDSLSPYDGEDDSGRPNQKQEAQPDSMQGGPWEQ